MAVTRNIQLSVIEDPAAAGYYCVSSYVTGDPGVARVTGYYTHLTWTEAVDVMLVLFDEHRPGQDNTAGGAQIQLW